MTDRVRERAVEVFGDDDKASRWLERPLTIFGNQPPSEVAKAEPEKVLAVLAKLEWGAAA